MLIFGSIIYYRRKFISITSPHFFLCFQKIKFSLERLKSETGAQLLEK